MQINTTGDLREPLPGEERSLMAGQLDIAVMSVEKGEVRDEESL
jgi:hypothetical protein